MKNSDFRVPGVILRDRGGHRIVDLTSELATHPDFDPDHDNYPADGAVSHRVRYLADLTVDPTCFMVVTEMASSHLQRSSNL